MEHCLMSLIKANDIQNASGGIPTVKGQQLIPTAWVNFNGTGTVAIRDSENVSSITDNQAGSYTINFAVAMANANYAATLSGDETTYNKSIGSLTTTGFRGYIRNDAGSWADTAYVTAIILGGQA
jgi:hypothetical protein